MPCDSMNGTRIKAELCLIAGVRTAPHFMEEFRQTLHDRFVAAGADTRSRLLFPYGDWSRRIVPQLLEIRRDMRLRPESGGLQRSIGGRKVLEAVEEGGVGAGDGPRLPVLIGHSGGGVAAVHAAALLHERHGGLPCPVVMIGSPKCRIPEALRGSVLYISAAGTAVRRPDGRRPALRAAADPIARLGSFGGWSRAKRLGWPVWRRDKHAPADVRVLPLAGGHADYFRSRAPFADEEGRTNLDRMAETVWEWLAGRLGLS